MRLLRCVFLVLAVACSVTGQTYTISTFAGGGLPVNIPGPSASLWSLNAVAADGAGNVFFAMDNEVLRLDAITGILSLAAGDSSTGFKGDNGPATSAALSHPTGLAVDSAGNLYIADSGNNRIRKVSDGVITTVAGNGTRGFSGDGGPATIAALSNPTGLAVDFAGNLYFADLGNYRIRKVSDGVITTVAGGGSSGDGGPATSAGLNFCGGWWYDGLHAGVAVDSAGNLYIINCDRIRKVSDGVITTVPGISGLFSGLAVDSADSLYMAQGDFSDNSDGDCPNFISKLSGGVITTVAGGRSCSSAQLGWPSGIAVDSAGNLYIADGNRIGKVSEGVITTVAGGGSQVLGDNGPAISAQLALGSAITGDSAGNLYISEKNRIRKVSDGVITTVAGNGTYGFSGDNGPAASASLSNPTGVAVDSAGNLYIADIGNNRIRKVSDGVITTVAGNGTSDFNGDGGPAASAQLGPTGVAVDSAGNLYIADLGNHRIRKVSDGVITTVAGNGTHDFFGEGGPATSAALPEPTAIAVDSAGNFYIADIYTRLIRKVSNGVITTVASSGQSSWGFGVDSAGNLYIAANNCIYKVSGDRVVTLLAGNGTPGFSGDGGPAIDAQLDGPAAVGVDPAGNIYIADLNNHRVRLLQPQPDSSGGVTNAPGNRSAASGPPR